MTGQPRRTIVTRRLQQRVGRTLKARLQWALDFACRDLDALTAAHWSQLRREFLAFNAFVITPDALDEASVKFTLRRHLAAGGHRSRLAGKTARSRPTPTVLPPRRSLERVQRQWRAIVTPLLEPEGHLAGIGPFHVYVDVDRIDVGGRSWLSLNPVHDPGGRLQLATLLGLYAHLLHVCPERVCQRWFVATRKGQTFCSRTCQNRATIREYRAATRSHARTPRRKSR